MGSGSYVGSGVGIGSGVSVGEPPRREDEAVIEFWRGRVARFHVPAPK
jgi:hypothetical protein